MLQTINRKIEEIEIAAAALTHPDHDTSAVMAEVKSLYKVIVDQAHKSSSLDELLIYLQCTQTLIESLKGIWWLSDEENRRLYEMRNADDLDSLPTFGGPDLCEDGVWSWDETRVLTGQDGWVLISREEWDGHHY